MQARTKKLEPVVRHVDKNEQDAMQAVAYARQQLQMQQEILEKLRGYKAEYTGDRPHAHGTSFSALQLQEFNRFLAQLDETIRKQQQTIELAQRELDIKLGNWQAQRSRAQAMHKVVDRLQASEHHQQQRSEQKLMDEFALRNLIKHS